jgi:hypothetical protein
VGIISKRVEHAPSEELDPMLATASSLDGCAFAHGDERLKQGSELLPPERLQPEILDSRATRWLVEVLPSASRVRVTGRRGRPSTVCDRHESNTAFGPVQKV